MHRGSIHSFFENVGKISDTCNEDIQDVSINIELGE